MQRVKAASAVITPGASTLPKTKQALPAARRDGARRMKLIIAVVKPFKLDEVREAANQLLGAAIGRRLTPLHIRTFTTKTRPT